MQNPTALIVLTTLLPILTSATPSPPLITAPAILPRQQTINGASNLNGYYCPGPFINTSGDNNNVCCVGGTLQLSDCAGWPICTGPTTSVPEPSCRTTIATTESNYNSLVNAASASLSSADGIVFSPNSNTEGASSGSASASASASAASSTSGGSSSSASAAASSASSKGGAMPVATGGAMMPLGMAGMGLLGLAAWL